METEGSQLLRVLLAEKGVHPAGEGRTLWGLHTISVATTHSAKDKYKWRAMAKHPCDVL